MLEIILGVDLGLRRDWTAIVAVERHLPHGEKRHRYDVIHLERCRSELPVVVDRVAEVRYEAHEKYGDDSVWLVIDWTGVGVFAPGLFKDAGLNPIPVCITGGHKPNFHWQRLNIPPIPSTTWAEGTVPKRELVSALQVLVETGRLRFAKDLPNLDVLVHELGNFRAKINLSGHDTYEAWREGDHDDTVLATALACWFGERGLASMTPSVRLHA